MKNITAQHDLGLGKWGPYNKEYLGVSHIANEKLGATFGVELFPALYRRRIVAASAISEGDVRMFGANAERTSFVYRYELEWRDRVYIDAHFNIADDRCVYIDCDIVNNTDEAESINIFLAAGMEYPKRGFSGVNLGNKKISEFDTPDGITVIDALDYADISCAETLAREGGFLGEVDAEYASGMGTVVGKELFFAPEHFLKYNVEARADSVAVRYRADADTKLLLNIDGETFELKLSRADDFALASVSFPMRDIYSFTLSPTGGVDIDAVMVGKDAGRVEFLHYEYGFEPTEKIIDGNSMTLKYKDSPVKYRIEWENEALMLRTLYTDSLGELLNRTIHNHISTKCYDGKPSEGVYEVVRTAPVYLSPNSKARVSFKIEEISDEILPKAEKPEEKLYGVLSNSDGAPYEFSHNMMAYNLFLNVVYPIYARRGYIRHSTPGRRWNCLYTWDSGMIGIGLASLDYKSAYENLRAYLTPVGDKHCPYILRGSTVPTQFFLYLELLNKYPEKREDLLLLYPMMMQYYNFFSDMRYGKEQMKSGVLKPWHIFYNSGGWDDYPAQECVRHLTGSTVERHNANITPVITTSLAVLIAKIMKNVSRVLGITENDSKFDADIAFYSDAVQKNLWDGESGYYSYLVHDEEGNPKEFLRYTDGTNYNMGLDGAYPYIAGISNAHQSERILENLKRGCMTEYGLGAVDTRAPYYTPYGYWNGSVWMPHQWIAVKALLDRGEADFALEIAKTALSVWKREVDNTYLCFEHFMSENGRGAGFHQFSGLSSPILSFFEMLYKRGTVTCGFGTAVTQKSFSPDADSLDLRLISNCGGANAVICMNDGAEYIFTIDGKTVGAKRLTDGAYAISLGESGEHRITVRETKKIQ